MGHIFAIRMATNCASAATIRSGSNICPNGRRRLLRNFFRISYAVVDSSEHQERLRQCRILGAAAHLVAVALTLDRIALLHVLLVSNGGSLNVRGCHVAALAHV